MAFWHRARREDAQTALLNALLADATARHTADSQLVAKRLELELRKEELHLQYAETEAKAKSIEREENVKLRMLKREAGMIGGKKRAENLNNRQSQGPDCKVCKGEIHLMPFDIAFHHAGHPAQFTMGMEWN